MGFSEKNELIYVELRGGFANQLFRWATFCNFAQNVNSKVVWDDRLVVRPFMPGNRLLELGLIHMQDLYKPGIVERLFWRAATKMPKRVQHYISSTVCSSPPKNAIESLTLINSLSGTPWYRGYFQQPENFSSLRSEIQATFDEVFSKYFTEPNWGLPYAALHVRRGDYVSNSRNLERLGVCTTDYYVSAISIISDELQLFIVSDDPEWCRKILIPRISRNATIIAGQSDFTDFALLRNAKEIVLSNSTFSWWAAFTGRADKKIVPSPWFEVQEAGGNELHKLGTHVLDKNSGKLVAEQ